MRERYADAKRDLARASKIEASTRPPTLFFNRLMSAIVALVEERWWYDALDIAAKMEARCDCKTLPAQSRTLVALRIEALLSRLTNPAMLQTPREPSRPPRTASPRSFPGTFPLKCPGLALLRDWSIAIQICSCEALWMRPRSGRTEIHRLTRIVLYAQIELACRAAGNEVLDTRAALQGAHYRRIRRASLGEGRSDLFDARFQSYSFTGEARRGVHSRLHLA